MQNFTEAQKRKLLKNPNVLKLTAKQVIFKSTFKVKAVQLLFDGLPPNQIFIKHDLDPSFFTKEYCRDLLKKWKIKYLEEGKDSLMLEKRGRGLGGGRKPKLDLDSMDKEDLKSIIATQKEMIVELKKIKALAKKK